jgi:hypothetical protein
MARKKKLGVERKDKRERKIVWHARGRFFRNMVDERGFEPPASSLRTVGKIS